MEGFQTFLGGRWKREIFDAGLSFSLTFCCWCFSFSALASSDLSS